MKLIHLGFGKTKWYHGINCRNAGAMEKDIT